MRSIAYALTKSNRDALRSPKPGQSFASFDSQGTVITLSPALRAARAFRVLAQ